MKSLLSLVVAAAVALGSPEAHAADPDYRALSISELERARTSHELEMKEHQRKMLFKGAVSVVAVGGGVAAFSAALFAPWFFAGPAGALLLVGGAMGVETHDSWKAYQLHRDRLAQVDRLLAEKRADEARLRSLEALTNDELLARREELVARDRRHRTSERIGTAIAATLYVVGAAAGNGAPPVPGAPGSEAMAASAETFRGAMEARSSSLITLQQIADIDRVLLSRGVAVSGSNVDREGMTRPATSPIVAPSSGAFGAGYHR